MKLLVMGINHGETKKNKKIDTMKSKIKLIIKSVCCLCLIVVATGCDLEVHEKFVFDPDTDPQYTFGSTTPWEWIQTDPKGDFSLLKQAIEITGMQAEFSDTSNKRTLFLLKNIGWTKSGGLFPAELKVTSLTDPKLDINKLRNILRYHIITTYVDQGPDNLYILDKNYFYTSLYYTGTEFDKMSIYRDRNYGMNLNRAPELLPTKKGAGVKLHNYIFSNGNSVAHLIEDFVRNNNFNSNP